MTDTPRPPSAHRLNGEALAALTKSLPHQRSRPQTLEQYGRVEAQAEPVSTAKMHRQDSKMGLRGIFTRNRPESRSASRTADTPTMKPQRPPLTSRSTGALDRQTHTIIPSTVLNRGAAVSSPTPSQVTITTSRNATTRQSPSRRNSTSWHPPPLFQSFTQAVIFSQLMALTTSADAIIRSTSHKRNSSIRDDASGSPEKESSPSARKNGQDRNRRHRRQLSASISKSYWTKKVYVLVSPGYLLQYAGEGAFDRLPEKIVQLGKDSVAFASDAIPGKHWVLQVSQAMNADGTPVSDPRSILSRIAFRGSDHRKQTSSMLLIFSNADDMDAWITAVRREIEMLGGKKYVKETGESREGHAAGIRRPTSSKYPTSRKSDRYSSMSTSQTSDSQSMLSSRSPEDGFVRYSINEKNPPSETQSITTNATSLDGQLDGLRDSVRFSFVSSGPATIGTSQASSPEPSPKKDRFDAFRDLPLRRSSITIREQRRSMQPLPLRQSVAFDTRPNYISRPASSLSRPPSRGSGMSQSAPTPNFSMPSQTNERAHLTSPSPPRRLQPLDQEPSQVPPMSSRKPPRLNIIVPSSYSTLDESKPSPKLPSPRLPMVFTSTSISLQKLHKRKPSLISIPARNSKTPAPKSPLSPLTPMTPATPATPRSPWFYDPTPRSTNSQAQSHGMTLRPPPNGRLEVPKRHNSVISNPEQPPAASSSVHRAASTIDPAKIIPLRRQFEPRSKPPEIPAPERPNTADRPRSSQFYHNDDPLSRTRPMSMQPTLRPDTRSPPASKINFSRPVSRGAQQYSSPPVSPSLPPDSTTTPHQVSSPPASEMPPGTAVNMPLRAYEPPLISISAVTTPPAVAEPSSPPVFYTPPQLIRSPPQVEAAPATEPTPPTGTPGLAVTRSPTPTGPVGSSPPKSKSARPPHIHRTASPTLQRLRQENPKLGGRRSLPRLATAKQADGQSPTKPRGGPRKSLNEDSVAAGPPRLPPPAHALPPIPSEKSRANSVALSRSDVWQPTLAPKYGTRPRRSFIMGV